MARLLPLFPLQLVVLPGEAVPLHIFEPRYREMVGEAAARNTEFGIVRATEQGIARTGCTVTVTSIPARYPDGRFDVITGGKRRFRILTLDEEKEYLRAEVEFFSDDGSDPPDHELLRRANGAFELLKAVVEKDPVKTDPEPDSFRMAELISDLDFRGMMIESCSENERLRMFADFAGPWLEKVQYTAYMKKKSPTNGAGHKKA